MTGAKLHALAVRLHGREHGALQALADRLGANYDNLRHMAAGRRPVSPALAQTVAALAAAMPEAGDERELLRRTYLAFCAGARLRSEDVARLLAPLNLSGNRLRELGRDSDRGRSITGAELLALVRAWADEQRALASPGAEG